MKLTGTFYSAISVTSTSVLTDQELSDGGSGSATCRLPIAVDDRFTGVDSLRFVVCYYAIIEIITRKIYIKNLTPSFDAYLHED